MDQRKLCKGDKYIVRVKYKNGWTDTVGEFEAVLVQKNMNGWHHFRIEAPRVKSKAAENQVGKLVSVASRSVLGVVGGTTKAPAKKARTDKDTKKELEALVLMLSNFKIVAGVNAEGTGIVIDMEEIPRFRRLLTRMFGAQLGLE